MARLPLLLLLIALPSRAEPPSIPSALDRASGQLLGRPYVLDPLGEGAGATPDPDPMIRLDAFDCATFVETVMAMALTPDDASVLPLLTSIRYDGAPRYENRNHFFDSQWLTANARQGLLREVTHEVGGESTRSFVKTVTRAQWDRRTVSRAILLPEARLPLGSHTTSYLPFDALLSRSARIPSGTLFALVRQDRPGIPFVITHVGFIFQREGRTVVRHARREPVMRVVEEDLRRFAIRSQRPRDWKVLGLQLFEVRRPPDAPPPVVVGDLGEPGPDTPLSAP